MNRRFALLIVIVVLASAGAVVAGCASSKATSTGNATQSGSQTQNNSASSQGGARGSAPVGTGSSRQGQGTAPIFGSVASVSRDILTITTREGDTKVKLAGAKIQKTVNGTTDDLKHGEWIVITGQQGSDGSLMASDIQITPVDTAGQAGYQLQRQSQDQNQGSGQIRGQAPGQGQNQRVRPLAGSVVSLEEDILTVKDQQGGTSLANIARASIQKTIDGTSNDLKVSESVSVIGRQDSDGAISASNILIRPTVLRAARPDQRGNAYPSATATATIGQ